MTAMVFCDLSLVAGSCSHHAMIVNRLVELPADVQADKLQANFKGAEHFPTNAGVAPN
jgi:hypothetical protein